MKTLKVRDTGGVRIVAPTAFREKRAPDFSTLPLQ